MKTTICALIFSLFLFSCESKKTNNEQSIEGDSYSQSLLGEKKTYKISESVNLQYNDHLKKWKQYENLAIFIRENYTNTSANQSFEMSKELVENIEIAKDSLKNKELRKLGVYARLNTLYSEALRLQDMSTISSIKAEEVFVQINKIVNVFSSVNAKINSIYEQQNFDEEIEFDEAMFNFREEPELIMPRKKYKRRNGTIVNQKKVK